MRMIIFIVLCSHLKRPEKQRIGTVARNSGSATNEHDRGQVFCKIGMMMFPLPTTCSLRALLWRSNGMLPGKHWPQSLAFSKCLMNTIIFKKIIFYWRIIILHNFAVFCQTSTWISHRYTYIPSLLNLSPISHPSRLIQSPCLSFLSHSANSHWLSILHMVI